MDINLEIAVLKNEIRLVQTNISELRKSINERTDEFQEAKFSYNDLLKNTIQMLNEKIEFLHEAEAGYVRDQIALVKELTDANEVIKMQRATIRALMS